MKWTSLLLALLLSLYVDSALARIGYLIFEGSQIFIDLDAIPVCDAQIKPCSQLVSLFESVMLYGAESDITPDESTKLFANMITSVNFADMPQAQKLNLIERICRFRYKPPTCSSSN